MLPRGRPDFTSLHEIEKESSTQGVNKSTVARRAIKLAAIGLCNLSVRVHEIEKREVGGEDREAAEITAIIAIEVRTGRCLLNLIENRQEVEYTIPSSLPNSEGEREEKKSIVVHPAKLGADCNHLTRELTGRISRTDATTIYDFT